MSQTEAAEAILPCNGSRAWAAALAVRRPLGSLPELLAASDAAWWGRGEADWDEAFRSHPRIGERHAEGQATRISLQWSEAEQGALAAERNLHSRIAEGNRAYEEKFGRVFLVRAAGRTAAEILTLLESRLLNTPEAEVHEAAEQQRQITQLRLQRWLAEGEAHQA